MARISQLFIAIQTLFLLATPYAMADKLKGCENEFPKSVTTATGATHAPGLLIAIPIEVYGKGSDSIPASRAADDAPTTIGASKITFLCKKISPISLAGKPNETSVMAVAFNHARGIPDWVAYRADVERSKSYVDPAIAGAEPSDDDLTREGSNFYYDSEIPADARQAVPYSYASGNYVPGEGKKYAKGHLMPSHAARWDPLAQNVSFSFANAAPQHPSMNSGLWNQLERWIKDGAETKKLFVVTGTYGKKYLTPETTTIGTFKNYKVTVPACFYKILYQPETKEAIAFLVPNSKPETGTDWSQYLISISALEDRMKAAAATLSQSADYYYKFGFQSPSGSRIQLFTPRAAALHDKWWPLNGKWPTNYYVKEEKSLIWYTNKGDDSNPPTPFVYPIARDKANQSGC